MRRTLEAVEDQNWTIDASAMRSVRWEQAAEYAFTTLAADIPDHEKAHRLEDKGAFAAVLDSDSLHERVLRQKMLEG